MNLVTLPHKCLNEFVQNFVLKSEQGKKTKKMQKYLKTFQTFTIYDLGGDLTKCKRL
jgi:hypothetical protein